MATSYFTKYAKDVVPGDILTIDIPHEDSEVNRYAHQDGAEVQNVTANATEDGTVDVEVSVFLPNGTVAATVTLDSDAKVDGYSA